jgi:hypothetical protein
MIWPNPSYKCFINNLINHLEIKAFKKQKMETIDKYIKRQITIGNALFNIATIDLELIKKDKFVSAFIQDKWTISI